MGKFIKTLKSINDLIVFKHSVFALPFIFISMVISSKIVNDSVWFGWKLCVLAILAAFSARSFAMAVNRYADKDIDIKNPRTENRPSVDGRLTQKSILIFIALNGIIFILVAWLINDLAFYMSFPILFILGIYSYFKRFSWLAHLVLGLSLGLAPIAGSVAVLQAIPLWTIFLSIGVIFWVAGFDLLYSLQDIEFDKENNLFSIPAKFGVKNTLLVSLVFHCVTILFWILFAYSANLGFLAYFGIIISGIILWQEHVIVNKNFNMIDKAFFTLNGYLGIFFFIFILADRIFA